MTGTLRGKLSPEDCRRSYCRLREHEKNRFYQNNVDKDDGKGRDDDAVCSSAPDAFSALIGGVAEVGGDQTDNSSENGRLEGWGDEGCPAHVMESAGNIELYG